MLKIKVPATSANLSVGFDSLGLALSLFNEFEVKVSDSFQLIGFEAPFDQVDNNLFVESYTRCCEVCGVKSKPVSIRLVGQDIPISRGLGSSASIILAGVLAANEVHSLGMTKLECASIASDIEGHPDNVFACAFGYVTSVFKASKHYIHETFIPNESLEFTVLVPETVGKTSELRGALQKQVPLEDAVFQLSRMIHVPRAFQNGDFDLLKEVLQDKLHEPYRYPFIPMSENLQNLKSDDLIVCISGSGTSMLLISKKDISSRLGDLNKVFQIKKVTPTNGATVEVRR
jgi:homoserine kinase